MKRTLPIAIAALLATTLLASAVPAEANRYVQLYEQILARETSRGATPHDLFLANVAERLAQRTGRAEYRDQAVALFESALAALTNTPPVVKAKAARRVPIVPNTWDALRGLALVINPLRQAGRIAPATAQALRPIAQRQWREFLAAPAGSVAGDVDHNIRLAQALSCAAYLRFFKDDTTLDSAPIRERLEHYWGRIKATGDLDEDASNYTGLGIVHCIELAQLLGHEEDLRGPGFRRMFERQRDLISPTGQLPEFGDGYFHLDRDAFDFLFICEYAARLFDDPTFLTVARRLYDPTTYAKAVPDAWCRGLALLNLELSARAPAPLPAASLVNRRATRSSAQPVVDKLVLRTGQQPGDAMVLLDLYAAGSHAHESLGPSVAYYEVDGVPLFHNLGRRRTSSAIAGNSFWALAGTPAFPGIWKPGEWFTMTIPANMFLTNAAGQLTVGDKISFRNFAGENKGTTQLWFDNLRLEGRAGVKLLDDFESPQRWSAGLRKETGARLVTSPDHTQGAAAQALNWGALKGSGYLRTLAETNPPAFTADAYDALKLDLKYTGIRPYFHLRELCRQVDIGDQALPHQLGSARVEQRSRDACGEIVFSRYLADDARLTRRIVLTAEGCLVIHDRWSAGNSQATWTAGQLWQLYALKERGQDWFCGDDDGRFTVPDGRGGSRAVARRMLVKFATGPGTGTFAEEVRQPCHVPNPKNRPQDRFFTTGSKRTVRAGTEADFTLVVMPHDPAQDAQALAAAIRFKAQADGVEVVMHHPSSAAPIKVVFSGDGRWAVTRTPQD